MEITLYSVFAAKKKAFGSEEKYFTPQSGSLSPSNFQVSAKVDEESRKDSQLVLSFLLTLNDPKGLITYEFRGSCNISGSSADFASLMDSDRNRIPRVLDMIYQRLYPVIFMLAGVTYSPYPQSVALMTEMVSAGPAPAPSPAPAAHAQVAPPAPAQATPSPSAPPAPQPASLAHNPVPANDDGELPEEALKLARENKPPAMVANKTKATSA